MRATCPAAAAAVSLLLCTSPRPLAAAHLLLGPAAAGAPADLLVVATATLAAWALAAWLGVTVALSAGTRVAGPVGRACERALRRTAPVAVRRAVALALGIGVVIGGGGPASAASQVPAPAVVTSASTLTGTDLSAGVSTAPGSSPRPVSPTGDVVPPSSGPALDWPVTSSQDVVVRPGDTLWALAASRLPPGTTASDVAMAWPGWWSANRVVIGDDPDLLHPGQHLHAPAPGPA